MKTYKFILLLAMIAPLVFSGCAIHSWSRETVAEESTFLTLHAIDGMQTANIAHVNCGGMIGCHEEESAWAIGKEPSAQSTAAYFAAIALIHLAVTNYLCAHHANPWVIRGWELIGIAWNVRDVRNNMELGIRP